MTDKPTESRIPGFYNLSIEERRARLSRGGLLTPEELAALTGETGLSAEQADHMIENVVGVHALPLGLALNFVVNGREVLVPMATRLTPGPGAQLRGKWPRSAGPHGD